jgi:hypothetical protein
MEDVMKQMSSDLRPITTPPTPRSRHVRHSATAATSAPQDGTFDLPVKHSLLLAWCNKDETGDRPASTSGVGVVPPGWLLAEVGSALGKTGKKGDHARDNLKDAGADATGRVEIACLGLGDPGGGRMLTTLVTKIRRIAC